MKQSFLSRFWQYQSERFPLLAHGVLIAVFTFSAVSYARLCRGATGFIPWPHFLVGACCTITLFLLVRIFDEHKDAEDDAQFRPELPVPRGLISLQELRWVGGAVLGFQLLLHLVFFPKMLVLFAITFGYLCLMGVEFFVPDWLRRHQFWYVTSHMFIIPLVDVYASGLDWHLNNVAPPLGLVFFFMVSYLNGIVLEIGRKIRTPQQESEGVLTYTAMLGTQRAVWLWVAVLALTLVAAIVAARYAGGGMPTFAVLTTFFVLCLVPAVLFLKKNTAQSAKWIEYAAGGWTLVMYATLGAIPMISALIGS